MLNLENKRKVVYIPTPPRIINQPNLNVWQVPQYGINRYAVPSPIAGMPRQDFSRLNAVSPKPPFMPNAVPQNTHRRFVNYAGDMCGNSVNSSPVYPIGLNDYPPAAQAEINFAKIKLLNGGIHVIDREALKHVFEHAHKDTDFGAALYLNPYQHQAEDWAQKCAVKEYLRKKKENKLIIPKPILNIFEMDDEAFYDPEFLSVIFGKDFDPECMGTIAVNRNTYNPDVQHLLPGFIQKHHLEPYLQGVDIMRGPMAKNDIEKATVGYIRGKLKAEEAIDMVKDPEFNDQIALKTPKALELLRHIDSIELPFDMSVLDKKKTKPAC